MKRILSLFLAALMVLSLAACGAEPAAPEASEEPAVTEAPAEEPAAAETPAEEPASSGTHIVVDFKGEETEVPDEIDRVVILGPLPAATVYAVFMGGDISKLVGVTPDLKNGVEYSVFAKYCPEITDVSSDFYAGGQLNMEELVKLDPDVVFYHSESDAEPIRQAGIPAVALTHPNKGGSASPLETLRSWMDTYAQTFRMTSSAQNIIAYGEEVESEIRSRIEANPTESVEKYLYINTYSDSGLVIAGAKSFAAWWTDLLGAENLGARATNSSVNMEQIYEWNPDKIFILTFSDKTPADIYNNTVGEDDWSGITAVKEEQVFKYPFGMHRWWPPCTDTPLAMWWSAKTAYPELFTDVDMDAMVKEYYQKWYGMELTDEDVANILTAPAQTYRHY